MGLVFCDGFELNFADDSAGIWDAVVSTSVLNNIYYGSSSGARTGKRVQFDQYRYKEIRLEKTLPDTYSTLYGCLYIYHPYSEPQGFSSYPGRLLAFWDSGGNEHVRLGYDASYTPVLRTVGTSTNYTASGPLMQGQTGYFLRFKVTIDDSAGELWLEVDGETVIDQTGIDTRNGGNGDISKISLGINDGDSSASLITYDDLVIRDDQLPAFGSVYLITPDEDGALSDFSFSSGTAAWPLLEGLQRRRDRGPAFGQIGHGHKLRRHDHARGYIGNVH